MKKLITIIALATMLQSYSMDKKPKKAQRWGLDKPLLEKDIKNLFVTQYVHEQIIKHTSKDWLKIAQGNILLANTIKDINYECLCYGKNEEKYKDFCAMLSIKYQPMSDMSKINSL